MKHEVPKTKIRRVVMNVVETLSAIIADIIIISAIAIPVGAIIKHINNKKQ